MVSDHEDNAFLLCVVSIFLFICLCKRHKNASKEEFNLCMIEMEKARAQCDFGGCGNIVGSCYERRVNAVLSATEPLTRKLMGMHCKQAADSVVSEIENLNSKLMLLAPFDGTWGGYDVRVEMALLRYNVMDALAKECERKN